MRPSNGHSTSHEDQYEAFAKELTRRFDQTYAGSQPTARVTMLPLPGGDDAEVTIRVTGKRLIVEQFLVVYTIPRSVEIAWEMMRGAVDGARARSHDG